MIAGLGIDLVKISRIARLLAKYQGVFLERAYTAGEIAQGKQHRDSTLFFAGRWAVKEAAAKALGCGIGKNCALTDLEVVNNEFGAPILRVSGAAKAFIDSRGGGQLLVSLTHEHEYAAAVVVFEQ